MQHSKEAAPETSEKSRDELIIEDIRKGELTTRDMMKKWHRNPNQIGQLRLRAEGKAHPPPQATPAKMGLTPEGEMAAACVSAPHLPVKPCVTRRYRPIHSQPH